MCNDRSAVLFDPSRIFSASSLLGTVCIGTDTDCLEAAFADCIDACALRSLPLLLQLCCRLGRSLVL